MISFCLKSRKEKCTNFVDAFTFFSIPYFIYPFLGTYSAWKNNLYPDFVFYLFWISVIIGYVFFSIAYLFTAKPVYNIEDFLSEKKIKFVRMHHFILNQHIKLSDLIFFLAVFGVIIINIDYNCINISYNKSSFLYNNINCLKGNCKSANKVYENFYKKEKGTKFCLNSVPLISFFFI